MKFPCCLIIIILLMVSVSLQYQTWQLVKSPKQSTTQIISVASPIPSVLASTLPTPISSPSSSDVKLLYRVDNPSACSFTDTSKFPLTEDHEITKLQTWYNWSSNEITLDYVVKKDGQTVYEGVLLRKDCDPYQKQWCQAVDESVSRKFTKGDYSLVADTARICQNTLSEGNGFIFVYGK